MNPPADDPKFQNPQWLKRKLRLCEGAWWRCECCGKTDRPLDVFFFERTKPNPWDEPLWNLAVLCRRCIEVENGMRASVEKALLANLRGMHFLTVDLLQAMGRFAAEWPSAISKSRADRLSETELLVQEALGQPEIAETAALRKKLNAQIAAAVENLAPNEEIPTEVSELAAESARVGRLVAAFVDDYLQRQRGR